MGCDCGKPKCDGHCGVSPAVLQINNPSECVLFHRVEIPASMGDSTTNPPKPGAYKNTLLYYEADGEAFFYSSDGIPTKITGVTSDYACLENKPQINGVTLEGNKTSSQLGLEDLFYVNVTNVDFNEGTFTADKTYAEILEAYNAGKLPIVIVKEEDSSHRYDGIYMLRTYAISDESDGFDFVNVDATGGEGRVEAGSWVIHIGNNENRATESYGRVEIDDELNQYSDHAVRNSAVYEALSQKANQGDLATVATSGSYNDLSDKPTIPTVNNATLTIQKNGADVQTFTANQSTNATANITVPTKTSDLTNDGATGASVYIEESDIAPSELSGEGEFVTLEDTTDCSALDTQLLGNAEQTTYSGKNLFNFGKFISDNVSIQGITRGTATYTDNSITLTATSNDCFTKYNFSASLYPVITVPQNTDVTLSWETDNTSETYKGLVYVFGNDNGSAVVIKNAPDPAGYCTFNTGNYTEISLRLGVSTSGDTLTYSDIQVEYGSTATDYEPYVGGTPAPNPSFPMPISTVTGAQTVQITGENRLSAPSDYTEDRAGLIFTCTDGVYNISGQASSGSQTADHDIAQPYTIREGDYWHLCNDFVDTHIQIALVFTDGGIRNYSPGAINRIESLSAYAGKTVSKIRFYYNSGYNINGNFKPMILNGVSTATDFIPYQGQSYDIDLGSIELAKIGTYQDYIWNDDGTWKLHKATAVAVLDGTENWAESGSTHERFVIGSAQSTFSLLAIGTPSYKSKCDHFTFQEGGTAWTGIGRCGFDGLGTFWCMISGMSSLADFKTWLGTNNVRVYYPLATPTDTEITDETLLAQLEELADALGYDGVTNIISTSPELPAILSVSTYAGSAIPSATRARAGIVRIGDGINVDDCGTISVSAQGAPAPIVLNMTYDTTVSPWTDTDAGIILRDTPSGTFPAIFEGIQTFAVPSPVFTDSSTGNTLDAEGLYNLLKTGADVVLNGVPIGVRLSNTNGTDTFTVGDIVCDGVRLTKVGPFHIEDFDPDTSELVYSMDLSSYSATVSSNAVGTTMAALLPFAIRVYKRVTFDVEVDPDPQTEYAFEVQGTAYSRMNSPT